MKVTLEGDLLGNGTVYYHPEVAANILSFHILSKRFKSVRYDNTKKDAFVITRDDGSEMEFIPSKEGLYHQDLNISIKRKQELKNVKIQQKILVINIVEEIKRNFTKKEIEKVDETRRLDVIVGRPSRKAFEEMIKMGRIVNNKITTQDYWNAIQIYGEDLGVLKGQTMRIKPKEITVQVMEKPKPRNVILSIDIMYVPE